MTNGPGLWLLERSAAEQMIAATVQRRGQAVRSAAVPGRGRRSISATADGVSVVDVSGIIVRTRADEWDTTIEQVTHGEILAALAAAVADESTHAIVMRINSPGGSASGFVDFAQRVRQLGAQKPITARVESLAASGGFWLASACQSISAATDALLGSVGVVLGIADFSAMFAAAGIKIHAIASGPLKATGLIGTEITPDQIASLQKLVDSTAELFVGDVRTGRRLSASQVEQITSGAVWMAGEASRLGLVDRIENYESCISRLSGTAPRVAASVGNTSSERNLDMATNHVSPEVTAERSRVSSILAAFGDNDFSRAQIASGASLSEAKSAAFDAGHVANTGGGRMPGNPGLGGHSRGASGGEYTGDAVADFDEAVKSEMTSNGGDRALALRTVVRRDPALHQAFVLATNKGRETAVREKFAAQGV